jgi:hypothetical protein
MEEKPREKRKERRRGVEKQSITQTKSSSFCNDKVFHNAGGV